MQSATYRAFALVCISLVATAADTEWTEAQKIDFLKNAQVRSVKSVSEGITGTVRATLADGTRTHDVSIQAIEVTSQNPSAAAPPEPGFTDRFEYNIAAYELDRMLKLNMVPATVRRVHNNQPSSFTWWIDNVLMTEKERYFKKVAAPNPDAWNDQIYLVRVFDQLIYNMDRNLGNLVIDQSWRIWMIDHTRAFRKWKQIKEKKNLVKCDRLLLERLRTLDVKELHARLDPYLGKYEIEALKARAELIVKFFDAEVKRKGAANVLYDYLPSN